MAKSLSPLKLKTWQAFSKFWRVKRCLETTGRPFVGLCVTCGKRFHIAALQAGHAFSGRTNAKLLTSKFIDLQCVICNETHHGREKRFHAIVRKRYGDKYVDRQLPRLHKVISDSVIHWDDRAKRYKRRTEKMLRAHGYRTYKELLALTRT